MMIGLQTYLHLKAHHTIQPAVNPELLHSAVHTQKLMLKIIYMAARRGRGGLGASDGRDEEDDTHNPIIRFGE
jgi:hypothetical protein